MPCNAEGFYYQPVKAYFIFLSNVNTYLIFMVIFHLFGFIPWIREEVIIKLPNDLI